MTKKAIELMFTMAACFSIVSCGAEISTPNDPDVSVEQAAINGKLAAGARSLALALNDPSLRAQLGQALAAKPTGDFEVLFRQAWTMPLGDGRTLGEVMASTGIADVPLAHVATPGGVPSWLSGEPVEVTWTPVGTDDVEVLEFYDGHGNVRFAPLEARPTGAVVVVAVNERVSLAADSTDGTTTVQSALSANACNSWSCTSSNCRDARLTRVKIYNDHEPWTKGDPEIYITCTTPGARLDGIHYDCGTKDLPGVNDENKWYDYNSVLFSVSSANGIQCYLMESDGGDGDDFLGSATIYYGDGARTYEVGDGAFKMN